MPENKTLLSWEVKKEKKDTKSFLFIAVVFLAATVATIYFLLNKEYLNGLVFIVLFLVLVWYFFLAPKSVSVAITESGFQISTQKYDFERFQSFWVSGKTGIFYFEPKKKLGSMASMPAGTKSEEEIKAYLPEELIETEDRGDDLANRMSAAFKI